VLHFNSAGNNDEKDPPRSKFKQLILVASTDENDRKSSFSNYGKGVPISAPGENILSTMPHNQYDTLSGTSMATPNAAGSAALIWSLHPSWNRDQVAAQLIGTADNIDKKNPAYKGMLGSGRINNLRALTEQVAPAKVTDVFVSPFEITGSQSKTVTITIRFDKLLDPNVVNQGGHWEIKSLSDFSNISANMKEPWVIGSLLLELIIPEMNPGKYQLVLKDSLKDPFGQSLDGKGEGKAGSNFVYEFEVA